MPLKAKIRCYKNPIVTFTLIFYNILFFEISQKLYALPCIECFCIIHLMMVERTKHVV
jgi:hypothetical protein